MNTGELKAFFNSNSESRRIALEDAVKACQNELVDAPDNADDETYNRAIRHCVEAIRSLI